MPLKRRKPSSSMCETISPISSMWPTIASVGPPAVPGTRAQTDPMTSVTTSANAEAASRNTPAGAVSYPDGPWAVSSERSTGGIDIGAP